MPMHLSNRAAARITALILGLLCHMANADVDAGIAAYHRGDYAAAFAEFNAAAKQNDPLALNVLGIMYAEGRGAARNDKLAVNLFFKAQTLGSLEASANLGRMFADGRGVPQSNHEALKHYRDAALGGYFPAMKRLAEIYERGELGAAPDPALAAEWRTRLQGTPTGLMHRPTPAQAMAPMERAHRAKDERKAPTAATKPSAPSRREVSPRVPVDHSQNFERRVLQQLEKYRQRERKLLVASTDPTPTLAAYLKDFRARLKHRLEGAFPTSTPRAEITVSLSILPDGTVREIEMDHGSGDARLDRTVLLALQRLNPMPPLPPAILAAADLLGVTVRLPIE